MGEGHNSRAKQRKGLETEVEAWQQTRISSLCSALCLLDVHLSLSLGDLYGFMCHQEQHGFPAGGSYKIVNTFCLFPSCVE